MFTLHRILRAAVCTSVLYAAACSEESANGENFFPDAGADANGTGGAAGSGGNGGGDAGMSSGGTGTGAASAGGMSSGGSGTSGAPADAGNVADANDGSSGAHTISFQVAFGNSATGDNCAATEFSGAGVASQTISLMDGSTCSMRPILGVTSACGGGGCSTCAPMPCESEAQVLSLEGVADGSYTLLITGSRGTVSAGTIVCFQVSASVVVSGADVALGSVTVPFDPDPAADALCNAT